MAVTEDQSTPFGDGVLEQTMGDSARTRILRYLTEVDGPREQAVIAEEIGVSQPMVSRAKQPLVERGMVEETADGLVARDDIRATVGEFQRLASEELDE